MHHQIDVHEARRQLSRLIASARSGAEAVIEGFNFAPSPPGSARHASAILALILSSFLTPLPAAEIPDAADACVKGMNETTPSSEFVAIEEGRAVRHERTTLEWQRCALGQTWDADSNVCKGRPRSVTWDRGKKLVAAVEGDWRLPTGEELISIVERCHPAPTINPQVFPNTRGGLYWTSSVDSGGLGRVWSVSFFKGSYYRQGTSQNGLIRLVRGTMKDGATP
ncbi:Lcl C-terminal domain-containing protein [Imhoffiella purpurea]|uniref:Lcl C-terminal domain-containing protein n=1 Tax=Imhoffiella purpurea TaxID=1249627 RepID=W9VVE8_9GAMM|nr:DUF1566 domain-containing protein [Imhoffiella purpurea]EXJ14365.1 hypothetical protein D779_2698 [Imhoffiella purpurea]